MAYNATHWPLHAPQGNIERCIGRYDAGYDAIRNARYERQIASGLFDSGIAKLSEPEYDQPWDEFSPKQRERRIQQMEVYAAMVERLDENIGRLIELLKQQGRLDNTLILFLSDNGACAETPTKRVKSYSANAPVGGVESYESYGKGWACVGNTPLRRFKKDSYERRHLHGDGRILAKRHPIARPHQPRTRPPDRYYADARCTFRREVSGQCSGSLHLAGVSIINRSNGTKICFGSLDRAGPSVAAT